MRIQKFRMIRMVRRVLSVLLAAMLLAASALAAEGDANFLRDDDFFQVRSGAPDGGCALGDALYLYTESQIYVWHPGDAQPSALDYALPNESDGEAREIALLFTDGERLLALCEVNGYAGGESIGLTGLEIRAINIDGDTVSFGEAAAFDAEPLAEDYGGGPELAYVNGAACAGGRLYLDVWIDGQGRRIYAQPLDGGAGEFLDVENIAEIAACEGQLLVETRDSGRVELLLLDPESGNMTPACAPLERESAISGLAYSEESGRLFYLDSGYVMAAENFDFANAEPVAGIMVRDSDEGAGFLLSGDFYAWRYGGNICVRATGGELPDARIVVQGGGLFQPMIDAYYEFNASHSDAIAVLREDFSDDDAVLNDIMSRDDSVDVRITMASSELFSALRSRGYLAPLDGAGIAEEIGKMYPGVQEALTLDGEIVAVPVYVGGWTMGFDAEGFAKLGIEDVPENWPDFLDLLPTLPELLPEDGSVRVFPDYSTQTQIRTELVGQLLDSWQMQLRKNGEPLRYDDPALAELLDEIMALDLDALGVDPGSPDEEYYAIAVSEYQTSGERNYTLVNTSVDCTLTGLGYNMPAMLSVTPGEEAPLPLDLAVIFVNPFSKHIDLAMEYAELACKHLDEYDRYSLDPSLNEPVPEPNYERWVTEAQQKLDEAQEKLEGADEADQPRWENEIAQIEKKMADAELNRWMISPEKIEWYRAHGERLMVREYSYVDVTGSTGEFSDLTQQFMAGRTNAQGFLKEIDRRVQMRMKEG